MAETSWSKLHEAGAGQVVIRETGPRVDRAITADDGRLYHELGAKVPGELAPAAEPARQLAPTEQQLRADLRAARDAYRQAVIERDTAATVAARARAHLDHCAAELSGFGGLDDQIAEFTTEALRQAEQRPRIDLPDQLRDRLTDRERARVEHGAAERAFATLSAELHQAKARADEMQRRAYAAANAMLAIEGERLAEHRSGLLAEADRITTSLFAADKAGIKLRGSALAALYSQRDQFARLQDTSAWVSAREELLSDPQARVVVRLPDAPPPDVAPVVAFTTSKVVVATPIAEVG